jgi:hypothetical protein
MRADNSGRHTRSKVQVKKRARKKQAGSTGEGDSRCGTEGPSIDAILDYATKHVVEKARPSIADLVRLLELRRELAESDPGTVTVKWIDRCAKPESEE